ncbi:MAG TPA: hypothetical protein VJX74_20670, partial [Blastocatellia bacterium]|nr:hypothetical protein [Blastocatellia bacterium]
RDSGSHHRSGVKDKTLARFIKPVIGLLKICSNVFLIVVAQKAITSRGSIFSCGEIGWGNSFVPHRLSLKPASAFLKVNRCF